MIFLGNILEVNKIKTIIVNYYNKSTKFDKNARYYANLKLKAHVLLNKSNSINYDY